MSQTSSANPPTTAPKPCPLQAVACVQQDRHMAPGNVVSPRTQHSRTLHFRHGVPKTAPLVPLSQETRMLQGPNKSRKRRHAAYA